MADSGSGQEKTEQPSDKRLKEGRDKGQVAKSIELNSLVIFTSGLILVYLTQSFIGNRISQTSYSIFSNLDILDLNVNIIQNYTKEALIFLITTVSPVLLGLMAAGVAISVAQVGFSFSMKALTPKMERFNPIAGVKRIFFSPRSLMEVLKSLLKLTVIGSFTYFVLEEFVLGSTNLIELTIPEIVDFMFEASYNLLWKISLVYALIASIDFGYQKFKFKKDMMMTKQEVKEESKDADGNPEIKSRIRRIQYQMAHKRMMKDVPTADVVITNPTHFAVAIKYDMNSEKAPIVVAKGMDSLAQKIKEIATKNNVPLYEDVLLARSLYKLCKIGDFIPEQLFKAVAQVLAYIYQLKAKKKKKSIV